jgi:hypothetical protein
MIDYTHAKTVTFPEGPAKAKVRSVACRKRRNSGDWTKKVDTIVIELAVIHARGLKDVYEDSIPVTRTSAWRIDELRKALGETLPNDDDPARATWDEQAAIGQIVFVWFSVWRSEKKAGNNIKYRLPADGAAEFEMATKSEEVSA